MKQFRIFDKLNIVYRLVRISRNPGHYNQIESLRSTLKKIGFLKTSVDQLKKNKKCEEFLKNRKSVIDENLSLDVLKSLPERSLGHQLFLHLKNNNLDIVYYSKDKLTQNDDESFYIKHLLETHDIWHVALGYSTSELDEISLQAFMLAQVYWPTAPFIIGGFIFRTLFSSPCQINKVLSAIVDGWQKAHSVKPLFLVQWNDKFSQDLFLLREELVIRPSL